MSYFVTGTDTDVGKTVVCAWLALHLGAAYWKPIQCGFIDEQGDRETVARLARCTTLPERYRLALPRSPHVAAAAEGRRIAVRDFALPRAERLIVEGAGGVLVPLNEDELMIDLIVELSLPAIVVARGVLGGINHALLTLEALARRAHPVAGVVFTGPVLPETEAAVETYGKTRVLGRLPWFERIDFPTLRAYDVPELMTATANSMRNECSLTGRPDERPARG